MNSPMEIIHPPADIPEIQRGDWLAAPTDDPVTQYLLGHHWSRSQLPAAWQIARLSHAAYVYRETATGWAVVVKFYAVKSSDKAQRHAGYEFERTQTARAAGLTEGNVRAVQPLSVWRGALFLEYVDGLTLHDIVAVRRSRPGRLAPALERAARLLATLHNHAPCSDASPDFDSAVAYARHVVEELEHWGVLERDPLLRDGMLCAIDRWASDPSMNHFTPALTHGDATTTNFIYPWLAPNTIVGIDWERLYPADPAADLGRLLAEVSHSIKQNGGSVAEALPFLERLTSAYCQSITGQEDKDALLKRACFYQASSTLRIARNGWVPLVDRMALVAHALVLLTRRD